MQFQIPMSISEVLVPFFALGLLLTGLLMFFYIHLRTKERVYLSIAIFAMVCCVYVFFKAGTVLSNYLVLEHPGKLFDRLAEASLAGFLIVLPMFVGHFLTLSPGWKKTLRALFFAGIGLTAVFFAVAFFAPNLFISVTVPGKLSATNQTFFVRGQTGPMYTMRDLCLGLMMFVTLAAFIYELATSKKRGALILPFAGLLIAMYTAIEDILYLRVNFYPDPLYGVKFSRFSFGAVVFILTLMAAQLRIFLHSVLEARRQERILAIANEKNLAFISKMHANIAFISDAATEIAEGNDDLSGRTERQAASLEETASSMEEMAATLRMSLENANNAKILSEEARQAVRLGVQSATISTNQMASIKEASEKISDISKIIESIAFQTNILALNAAVEAARAGEQGRGFAVVATEIRALAQNTAASVKEIDALVLNAVEEIKKGALEAVSLKETLATIDEKSQEVFEIVSKIALAASEQEIGIQHVNKAVSEMEQTTQQNATLVEEIASSSKTLEAQAIAINEQLNEFQTQAIE